MQSEAAVQAALERARHGRTTIIVAHRLSTIKAADTVIVLEEGAVRFLMEALHLYFLNALRFDRLGL